MAKKILLLVCLALILPANAMAYWGLGLKGGGVSSKTDDLQHEMDYWSSAGAGSYSATLNKNNGFGGLELFFEGNGASRWGLSLGFNGTAENKLDETLNGDRAQINASAKSVPVTIYWKHKVEDSNVAFRLGAGADIMKAQTIVTNASGTETEYSQTKAVPHVDAGVEWYIFKRVSLGVNLAYLFGAKFDELKGTSNGRDIQLYTIPYAVGSKIVSSASQPAGSNRYCQDYTGVRGDVALRVYFGGN